MPRPSKPPVTTHGIFLYSTRTKKILACHATNSPWNRWSIPKGLGDPGEDSFHAAARELQEETGIDLSEIHIVKKHSLPAVKYQKQNKLLKSFLVVTDTDLDKHDFCCHTLVNNEFPEVDKWKWIEPEQMKTLLHETQQKHFEEINTIIAAA
jgi:8-oxo-dGTP pyrophosphatase MutT (NUDIX family)